MESDILFLMLVFIFFGSSELVKMVNVYFICQNIFLVNEAAK